MSSPAPTPAPAGPAVFLSYASQDAAAAKRMCDTLRSAGVEVWFDQNELVGGDAWDAKIRKQIAECALFVPIISASTQARTEGYFRLEWKLAAQRTHMIADDAAFLLPVVIDDTRDADARVPAEFKSVQWTRLPAGESAEKFRARVKTLLGGEGRDASPRRPSSDTTASPGRLGETSLPEKPTRRRVPVAAWIAGALLVALIVASSLWLKHPASEKSPPPNLRQGASATTPTAPAAAAQKSVAVLAFKNLSGDPTREFFSDGLSEAVSDVLGRVPGLKVVGSASAFSFKGKAVPIPEIARQLGVTHLVEGTVLQDGSTVRITAKLTQADGFQVWVSDKLDRELKNIFALHDEVAGLIAKNLSLKLGVATGRSQREINPEAYQLYMQARQAWNLRNTEGLARAEGLLDRALKLEPDYAQAHAALADVWISRSGQAGAFGTFEHRRSPEKARVMAKIEHALRLDPDSAEARASLGAVAWYDWDFTTAERELRRAIALNPNYAPAHSWLGRVMQSQGRTDEALAELRLATEIDPLSPVVLANYCGRLVEVGRETEALAVAERALALQPDSRPVLTHKGHALLNRGLLPEAAAVARQLVATGPTDPNNLFPAVFILAGAGATAEATTMMAQLPARGRLPRSALLLAFGRRDEAIAALDAPGQNVNFLGYVLYDRRYDPIRSDPRFAKYLADLGLTEAHARAQAWRQAHPPEKPAK
ncbi:MAG: TIR domain-containing protein [Verrucomicrobia bacterium]|nr:TIR domain-containing protein [Verrucomicrobiota bacterium]